MEYAVIAFSSTHSAMGAEKFLRERFSVQVMPTPRTISASCGISVRVTPEILHEVIDAMEEMVSVRGLWQAYSIQSDGTSELLSKNSGGA